MSASQRAAGESSSRARREPAVGAARREPATGVARRGPLSRELVEQAALALFAERGYRVTTMEDIAGALGVRGPSLYKHVGSKQELLAGTMVRTMTMLIAAQRSAVEAGGNATTQLRRAVEAHVRFHATHREDAFVGNREIGSLAEPTRSQVLELRDTYERGLRAIIEQGRVGGEFTVADPRLVSYAILDMGMGVATWYRPDGEYDVDALAYAYADLAVGLAGAR